MALINNVVLTREDIQSKVETRLVISQFRSDKIDGKLSVQFTD